MTGRDRARRVAPLAACIAIALWAAGFSCMAQESRDAACSSCHDVAKKMEKGAHAALACTNCHEKHEEYPHLEGIAKPVCATCHQQVAAEHARSIHGEEIRKGNAAAPECGTCHGAAHEIQGTKSATFRATVPGTCGMCHTDIAGEYQASVHGKAVANGVMQAPVCTDCHGEHSILRPSNAASPVNSRNIRNTCGSCHGDVRLARKFGFPPDRLVSFDASFHGLAAQAGSQTVANCASCHGVHNILPSADPKSTVYVKNLAATCGRCHPGAGQRFAIGPVHFTKARTEPVAVGWVRRFYLWTIPITIGLMLLHNAGDWARKLYQLRFRRAENAASRAAGVPQFRMFAFERLQHALLAGSFLILVWSGFALKYPTQWWAQPLLFWEGSSPVRSLVHRAAAVVFIAVTVMHAVSLAASRKLRHHWRELVPAKRDISEAVDTFGYNLGVLNKRPAVSEHSYVEKAEYWAVVWGAVVMILTGVMLWANGFALAWLPKSLLDVATAVHFYEAVLATLAILVWHFYSVIFDADVYPLDAAAITGFSTRPRHAAPEAAEAPEESIRQL
ncbi:MAG TPA: cytochrome b/b6 domain-containing protein [Bryobacteraceae bacterium]|nr:cytochrome b/b6 domain-containing protein [Bryobacteraceae bacterium]